MQIVTELPIMGGKISGQIAEFCRVNFRISVAINVKTAIGGQKALLDKTIYKQTYQI
jgi:hypothetical protein